MKKLLQARLKKSFFSRETALVAQELLGKLLVLKSNNYILIGMIVETESYRSDDPASHAFIGKTERNSAMFGPVGHGYVYISHGLHYGFNIVARNKDFPAGGVLIRAVEPLKGVEVMKKNRKRPESDSFKNLTNGPGKFTQAFGIDKRYNNFDLLSSPEFFVAENILKTDSQHVIVTSTRIGISKGKSHLWRFFIKDNHFVSPVKAYK